MRNVDEAEVGRFEALAARWWDPEGEFKPLHRINPLRTRWIDQRVNLAGKRVLDVGCGGGVLAEAMAHRGAEVTGIDLGEASLAVARLHLEESGLEIDYRRAAAEDLADEFGGSFDVVACMELLEHVPRPDSVVGACARLLKPDGQAFFATLNRNLKSYLFAVLGAEYILNLLPRGTHDYGKFVKPSELARWARGNGLSLRGQTGLGYNPVTRRYFLQRGVDVNYIAHYVRAQD